MYPVGTSQVASGMRHQTKGARDWFEGYAEFRPDALLIDIMSWQRPNIGACDRGVMHGSGRRPAVRLLGASSIAQATISPSR